MSAASTFLNVELPIFTRNRGEIARTKFAVTQAEELRRVAEETVAGDVAGAFEGLSANDHILQLYRSGYLDESKLSLDISEYAYKRGAASSTSPARLPSSSWPA